MKRIEDIKRIAVVGAGSGGSTMAQIFAHYGYDVTLFDSSASVIGKSKELIRSNQEGAIALKFITKEDSDAMLRRIFFTNKMNDLDDIDFLLGVLSVDYETKCKLWSEISQLVRDDTILACAATNSSVGNFGDVVKRPERFVYMRWASPMHVCRLIEVVRTEHTSDETLFLVRSLAVKIGKKPVISKSVPGFILERIRLALLRECLHIVEEGIAVPRDVDDAVKYGLGLKLACLGLFGDCDAEDLDILAKEASAVFPDLCNSKEVFGMLADRISKGKFGIKTGSGFYDYLGGKGKEKIMYRDLMLEKLNECLEGGECVK